MRSYEEYKKKKNIGGKKSSGKGVKLSKDAQSIAARERRHRISERFKILQSLIPGGTKMDTVSMLEEAIHYVKFLKTQILWFHQNMIFNFAPDADTSDTNVNGYFLPPAADHQVTTTIYNADDLLSAQPPNVVVTEADRLPPPPSPQLGFPPQSAAYDSIYDQEKLMAMAFDANVFY